MGIGGDDDVGASTMLMLCLEGSFPELRSPLGRVASASSAGRSWGPVWGGVCSGAEIVCVRKCLYIQITVLLRNPSNSLRLGVMHWVGNTVGAQ